MPTFARLTAAVLLALLGIAVAFLAMTKFDDGYDLSALPGVAALMGVLVGWFFTGKRFHRQSGNAIGVGVTSALAQAILTLFYFSAHLMVVRAFRKAYPTVMDAIAGVFEAALEYLEVVGQFDVALAILFGGALVGSVTNWVGVRTR